MMPCGVFVYETDSSNFSVTDPTRFETRDNSSITPAARSLRSNSSETTTASIARRERYASSHKRSPSMKISSSIFPSRTARTCLNRELSRLVICIGRKHNLGPYRPVIGNVQGPGNTPSFNLHPAREDPVGVHSESTATPRCCSSRNRRRVTTRLEKLARVETFLSRQSVEVTKNNRWNIRGTCLRGDHFELGQLPIAGRMWIHVRVEKSNPIWTRCDSCGNREPRPPGAFVPGQIDSRHVRQRQTTQQRDSGVALFIQINRFFKVQPPLPFEWCDATRDARRS